MKKTPPIQITNEQLNHSVDLSDWEITHLFKNTIWAEFLDDINGDKVTKGGLHIPSSATGSLKDFMRIARVLKSGPDCSESLTEGSYILVPPIIGIKGMKEGPNGGPTVFLKEDDIMAVITPKSESAVREKEEVY